VEIGKYKTERQLKSITWRGTVYCSWQGLSFCCSGLLVRLLGHLYAGDSENLFVHRQKLM